MKNLLAIVLVALLATTFTFAADGTGTVNVNVTWPAISITNNPVADIPAYPGDTKTGSLVFNLTGAKGIAYTQVNGVWDKATDTGVSISTTTEPTGSTFSSAGTSSVTVPFQAVCATGIAEGTRTFTYTLTVNY